MPLIRRLLSLIIICVTIILLAGITRNSLCALHFRLGNSEVVAILAGRSTG
ncbi:Hok/Gef family protein [Pantoea sp. B65]